MEETSNQALLSGYFGVVPENMAIPIALFLSRAEAKKYADGAIVRKYPNASLFLEALSQDSGNP